MLFEKILVPLDGSALAECVLPYVEKLAQGCEVKEITLLRICEAPVIPADYPSDVPINWDQHVKEITKYTEKQCDLYLDKIQKELQSVGVPVKTATFVGRPETDIVEYTKKNNIDMIVMASHGRSGISRIAYGSISERVFRTACVPIMMIRAPGCVPGF
jgi:nucleotide-binding universal stress UspA family protein